MAQVIHLLTITLILSGLSSELELDSEESNRLETLSAVVQFGKRLKLTAVNIHYPITLWRFNGGPISEKCEPQKTLTRSTLVCADMDSSDAGLYEFSGINESGQKEILLAVSVTVAECTEERSAKQRIELVERRKCFCSGISDQCSTADDLYRSKIIARLTERDTIDLRVTTENVEEPSSIESKAELSTYYSLPKELKGNLLKSYGGYMDYPSVDDEIDEDKPDLVLQGKSRTLIYFNKRELAISGELSRNRVHMTEQNWRELNHSVVSRDTFLTVLSHVRAFYVKYNQYRRYEPLQIVLDSAGIEDRGLGKVTTVEKCRCRSGYRGLSCEDCSPGFYRRHAVREQGICVSLRQTLEPIALELQEQLKKIRNNYYK